MIRARLTDWWRRHTRLMLVAGLTVVAYLGALNRNTTLWMANEDASVAQILRIYMGVKF